MIRTALPDVADNATAFLTACPNLTSYIKEILDTEDMSKNIQTITRLFAKNIISFTDWYSYMDKYAQVQVPSTEDYCERSYYHIAHVLQN
jgi:hypothetical protein